MHGKLWFALAIISLLALGCSGSGGHNPIEPQSPAAPNTALSQLTEDATESNRHLWGLWKVRIGDDHQSVEVTPLRASQMHLNALRLLQETPCSDCLKIENVVIHGPNELSADLTLIHPYPGLMKYTGFDVRGIFISGSDYAFPASGRRIAWGDNLTRMLNSDGYTALFNPTEFPVTKPGPPALRYIPGHRAAGGDLSATLNPFLAYAQDAPRRMFESGGMETRTVRLHVPDGPLEFGYAVDVCWQLVDGEVTDPVTDFPPDANCLEAYQVNVLVRQGLGPYVGASAKVEVAIYDHQGPRTAESVFIEAPDLMPGAYQFVDSTVIGEDSCLFTGQITNELGADFGDYPLLVRVVDSQEDQNLGAIDAWQLVSVGVKEGWARTWGAGDFDRSSGVATDQSGNIYVAGYFHETVDFDPSQGIEEYVSNGDADAYLVEFDSSGNVLWVRTWGGEGYDVGNAVALDGSGDVCITGRFSETVDFDPGPGVDERTVVEDRDAYLSRFDSSGDFLWVVTWGGDLRTGGEDVEFDSAGNICVTGSFRGTVDFDPGLDIDEHTAVGNSDSYLSKFDRDGGFQWARTWGGPSFHGSCGRDIAVGEANSIYVSGGFHGTIDFDPGPGIDEHKTNGSEDCYLTKFETSGNHIWALTWGGTSHDSGRGVAADALGNTYVTGYFDTTVDFDPGPGTTVHTTPFSSSAFISKFNSGGEFQWVWVGTELRQYMAFGVAVDSSGQPIITGHSSQVFANKFDTDGALLWTSTWGSPYGDWGRRVAIDVDGRAYFVGDFTDTGDFDPGPSVEHHTSNGKDDAFLCKLLPDGGW